MAVRLTISACLVALTVLAFDVFTRPSPLQFIAGAPTAILLLDVDTGRVVWVPVPPPPQGTPASLR
jgi:hypothetical protein